jgi:uncharacterized protein YjbJ (UPF0337 family)
MSTSNSTVEGKFNEVAGKVKQGVGETFNNDKLANEGAAQQVKGHAQQAWGSVKEAAQDLHDRNQPREEQKAHSVRDTITNAAQNVKEHVQAGAASVRDKH